MPTALSMTDEMLQQYVVAARQSLPKLAAKVDSAEINQLIQALQKIAAVIKQDFGASRVILFGSVVHQQWFSDTSDIDIAIEGLSGHDFFSAWRLLEAACPNRVVDLVDLDIVSPTFYQTVEQTGIEL